MLSKLLPALFLVSPLFATLTVSLSPSVTSPQPVGTSIVWAPTATDTTGNPVDFRFQVSLPSGQAYEIYQDYDVAPTFTWSPYSREGEFQIRVTARDTVTLETAQATMPFTITARTVVSGGTPVITPTSNPLVALYSGPGCPSGQYFRVRFTAGEVVQRTSPINCSPSRTSNTYIAGMLPSTKYYMNDEIGTQGRYISGPVQTFTTGAISPALTFPEISIPVKGSPDTQQNIVLLNDLPGALGSNYFPFATNLKGQVIWYYDGVPPVTPYNMRPAPDGSILLLVADPTLPNFGQQLFREIDLSGNAIRQTSVTELNNQLIAAGKYPITELNHDAFRISNGHTLIIASQEMIFPAGTQGSTAPVDIVGNALLDLDQNMQIAWSWSAYDHLDINRKAVLGETCTQGQGGCPPIELAPIANDWIHGNSAVVNVDGSILFSSRHQDFIYKIDYANGLGSGDVIWTLGLGGDFTMVGTTDPYPWFSHQHDAAFELGRMSLMTVYDDGNTRVAEKPGEHSRGQALNIDEAAKTASLKLNADLGVYSMALGSAQLLDNGDYHFESGLIVAGPGVFAGQAVEVTPEGVIDYDLTLNTSTYRSYRMATLYSIP